MSLLLGAPESRVKENDITTWETNKIGGSPDWFKDGMQIPPCTSCKREMILVTQIYCPLTDSPYHRCLHVFVCPSKLCSSQSQGWRVVRTQLLDGAPSLRNQNTSSAKDTWNADQDDWGQGQDDWGQDQDDWGQNKDDWGQGQDDWGQGQDDWCQSKSNCDHSQAQLSEGVPAGEGRHPPGTGTVDGAASSLSEMTISEATASSNIPARGATSLPNRDQQDSTQSKGNRSYADTVSQGSPVDTLSPCSLTKPLSPCSPTEPLSPCSPTEPLSPCSPTEPLSACSPAESLEKEVTAASQDANANNSDVEGLETMQEVEAEGIAVDDESVQRMMGLLAAQQDPQKSRATEEKETAPAPRSTFPAHYLEVFAESEVEEEMSDHVVSLLEEYKRKEGKEFAAVLDEHRKGRSGADREKYDKTEVKHGDKQCYRFIKRLQLYPQQCIRYQWNGSPLLISKPSGTLTTDRCENCGASRVFELQLVPPLIPLLKLPGETESSVEFGTVLVFTCRGSCWSDSDVWREEYVLLQHDPDQHRFR